MVAEQETTVWGHRWRPSSTDLVGHLSDCAAIFAVTKAGTFHKT